MAAKKILVINGSPRKNGMTAALIEVFIKKIGEINENRRDDRKIGIERVDLYDLNIRHCTGCDSCLRKPYQCPLDADDDMPDLAEKLIAADAIIIGAPSYFGSVPGAVKDLIDRSRPLKMAKYKLADKLFSVITASGLTEGGNNWVADCLIRYALIQGMIVVGALGHPVIMPNLPAESLQKTGLKEFRKPGEPGEIAVTVTENLAVRIAELLGK